MTGGWVRPATFGMMDGLVSNLALLAGVIGGGAAAHIQVLTGLAGLVAGACSMAVGEFTSISSQSELIRAEIAKEKRELADNPDEELAELTLIYRSKGLHQSLAAKVASEIPPAKSPRDTWPDRSHITTLGLAHLGKRFDGSVSSPTRVVGVRPAQRTHRGARVLRARGLAAESPRHRRQSGDRHAAGPDA